MLSLDNMLNQMALQLTQGMGLVFTSGAILITSIKIFSFFKTIFLKLKIHLILIMKIIKIKEGNITKLESIIRTQNIIDR